MSKWAKLKNNIVHRNVLRCLLGVICQEQPLENLVWVNWLALLREKIYYWVSVKGELGLNLYGIILTC